MEYTRFVDASSPPPNPHLLNNKTFQYLYILFDLCFIGAHCTHSSYYSLGVTQTYYFVHVFFFWICVWRALVFVSRSYRILTGKKKNLTEFRFTFAFSNEQTRPTHTHTHRHQTTCVSVSVNVCNDNTNAIHCLYICCYFVANISLSGSSKFLTNILLCVVDVWFAVVVVVSSSSSSFSSSFPRIPCVFTCLFLHYAVVGVVMYDVRQRRRRAPLS